MLSFLSGTSKNCEGIHRREMLKIGALSGLGLTLPQLLAAEEQSASDVNCILIWTRGGTSHHDTFDPKPQAPASVRGEFKTIDTAIPGVQFSEIVPNFAKEANRFALLRGWNPRNGSHGRADQEVMSGHKSNASLSHPTMGSVISQHYGFRGVLPPFVQLGTQIDNRFGGGTAGFLGIQYNPFVVDDDPNSENFVVRDITPPGGMKLDRVHRRKKMLRMIDQMQSDIDQQPTEFSALDEHTKAALNIVTSPTTKKAFEIEKEDPRLRDRYGRHRFGQSCLLARRLIESGVRFVTVSDGGWDTHQKNFNTLKTRRVPPVDQALPQLVIDLEERGLLEKTLVVWLTDFGRTPQINAAGGRDHWASAGFAMFAGAGLPGGSVVGRTDDEGGRVVDDEYHTQDIAATIFHKMGLPLHHYLTSNDGRPVALNEGGRVIWS